MKDYYNINVEGSHFDHGSCVVYNDYGQAASDQVLLAEINSTIERIEKTEPLIAKALNELQHAIEEQNKPKISTLISLFFLCSLTVTSEIKQLFYLSIGSVIQNANHIPIANESITPNDPGR